MMCKGKPTREGPAKSAYNDILNIPITYGPLCFVDNAPIGRLKEDFQKRVQGVHIKYLLVVQTPRIYLFSTYFFFFLVYFVFVRLYIKFIQCIIIIIISSCCFPNLFITTSLCLKDKDRISEREYPSSLLVCVQNLKSRVYKTPFLYSRIWHDL